MYLDHFKLREDETDGTYVHEFAPVWLRFYPNTDRRPRFDNSHWQAYRAVEKVPAGRAPWSVDNRRLSPDGFATAEEAAAAACALIAREAA